jgi:hypothetical protein
LDVLLFFIGMACEFYDKDNTIITNGQYLQ